MFKKDRKKTFTAFEKKHLLVFFIKCILLNIYLNNIHTIILHTLDTTRYQNILIRATNELFPTQGEHKSQNDVKMMSKCYQILIRQYDVKLLKFLMFS